MSHETVEYRGYRIYWNPKPIPESMVGYWSFVADGYDGAEDSDDGRCGDAHSVEDAKRQIDEQIEDAEFVEPVKPISELIIAEFPPQDGKDYDCQCARCGSSADHQECDQCCGDGVDGHECGEDCCMCADPEDNVRCYTCRGRGGWYRCMSSKEFCEANPLPGREQIERGLIEWFPIAELSDC